MKPFFFTREEHYPELELLTTRLPLALLPIRIETRYSWEGWPAKLKIRIYPDEILSYSHDSALTEIEALAGQRYWATINDSNETGDRHAKAWAELTQRYAQPRAAWIVRRTQAQAPADTTSTPGVRGKSMAYHLPLRWVVIAYRNGKVEKLKFGKKINSALALTMNLKQPKRSLSTPVRGPKIDEESSWAYDYDNAENVGMAVTLDVDHIDDVNKGFERILVIGINNSLNPKGATPANVSKWLGELIEGHHYTRGVSFVRQGTPTNNSTEENSGYTGFDSYQVERGMANRAPRDGGTLLEDLGVDKSLARYLPFSELNEQKAAERMNAALWPVTFGYWADRLLAKGKLKEVQLDLARTYFLEHVRGRGHYPILRAGRNPYGFLPVTSLNDWKESKPSNEFEVKLTEWLRLFWDRWLERVKLIPMAEGRDMNLLAVLSMEASSKDFNMRRAFDYSTVHQLFLLLNGDGTKWPKLNPLIPAPFDEEALKNIVPEMADFFFEDKIRRNKLPLITEKVTSEIASETPTKAPYLLELARKTPNVFDRKGKPKTLLHLLMLCGQASDRGRSQTPANPASRSMLRTSLDPRVAELVTKKIPTVAQETYEKNASEMAKISTADLERLLTETLDVASHRLDAWVSSLASRRLKKLRSVTGSSSGLHVGAYGWVENLKPRYVPSGLPNFDPTSVEDQNASHGYVHAPSMNQAATAALLRNGWATHSQSEPYTFDLSSKRVRRALDVLDAVRHGQPLGAVLGYYFEREMHDNDLDLYVEPLRRAFAFGKEKTDAMVTEADETITARNVVNGFDLLNAWREQEKKTLNLLILLRITLSTTEHLGKIEARLKSLDALSDALSDLLSAESVHQLVSGNPTAAGATLDAVAKGYAPPDPEVVKQPRNGTPVGQRFVAIFDASQPEPPGWQPLVANELTPRALAEPALDRWAGKIIGNAALITCQVRYRFADSTAAELAQAKLSCPVTLADLRLDEKKLRPLDILAIARNLHSGEASNDLDWLIISAAARLATSTRALSQIEVIYDRSWLSMLETARTINQLFTSARALREQDLMSPNEQSSGTVPNFENRASTAEDSLASALVSLNSTEPTALLAALEKAALLGVEGAVPPNWAGTEARTLEALRAQAAKAKSEIERRIAKLDPNGDDAARLKAVFGADFLALPKFPANGELAAKIAAGTSPAAATSLELRKWAMTSARIRPALQRWRRLAAYYEARIGMRAQGLALNAVQTQSPTSSNEWLGSRFSGVNFPDGGTSIVAHYVTRPNLSNAWSGLFLDEWTETVPAATQKTGIAFHYDDPGAEAPQTVLLAVAPNLEEKNWRLSVLADVLNETLDLAKMRAVDPPLLRDSAQFLPATFLPASITRGVL